MILFLWILFILPKKSLAWLPCYSRGVPARSFQHGTDSAGLLLPWLVRPYHIPAWQVLRWIG